MFAIHRCTGCGSVLRRSDCVYDPDGVFGPELLCPRCGELLQARFTAFGWAVTLLAAVLLILVLLWLQSRG
jgi:hypothetical protein